MTVGRHVQKPFRGAIHQSEIFQRVPFQSEVIQKQMISNRLGCMKYWRIVCALPLVIAVCSCIRIEPIENHPEWMTRPIDAKAVAVGISMRLKQPLMGSFLMHGAYFVRLDEKEDILKQDRVIISTNLKYGHIYLLNAQPGRYAIVAAMFPRGIYLLPKRLVEQTVTTVAPGTVGYLGEYEVETSYLGPDGGDDDVEQYYFKLLGPQPRDLGRRLAVRLLKGGRDVQREQEFLRITNEKLLENQGGEWSTWIQEQLRTR